MCIFNKPLKLMFLCVFALGLIILMVIFPDKSILAASNAVNAWLTIIIPSLMPFSLASLILINSGLIERIFTRSDKIIRSIIGFNGCFVFLFLSSCLSGYPMGAKLTGTLRKKGSISETEAAFLVNATSTTGPLFLVGSVALGILKNASFGAVLLLSHYTAAASVAFINGRIYKKTCSGHEQKRIAPVRKRIGVILSESVSDSVSSMLAILAFMMLFFAAAEMLEVTGIFSVFPLKAGAYLKAICSGLLEVTSGCIFAGSLEHNSAIILISFFCGFGGASIIAQTISVSGINRSFVISKLFQGSLSAILCAVFSGQICRPLHWLPFAATAIFAAITAELRLRKHYHLSFLFCRRAVFSFNKSKLSL